MIIDEANRKWLKGFFNQKMEKPVKLIAFSQRGPNAMLPLSQKCESCEVTENLAMEIGSVLNNVAVQVVDFLAESKMADEFGVTQIPCIVMVGEKDSGIRFYGMPGGYELLSFVETIVDVSRGTTELSQKAKDKLRTLENKVNIKVFVTSTCPYCPQAVRIANRMAVESELVTAETFLLQEFPHLAQRYAVSGVPKIVLNENFGIDGAVPDYLLADHVLRAAGQLAGI